LRILFDGSPVYVRPHHEPGGWNWNESFSVESRMKVVRSLISPIEGTECIKACWWSGSLPDSLGINSLRISSVPRQVCNIDSLVQTRSTPSPPSSRCIMALAYSNVTTVANVAIATLNRIGVTACFVGGMACRLYGNERTPQVCVCLIPRRCSLALSLIMRSLSRRMSTFCVLNVRGIKRS
jgi:hypothetical protein